MYKLQKQIISQLGNAGQMQIMVGASFSLEENNPTGVLMNFKGNRSMNYCRITLDEGTDTYKVEFLRLRKYEFTLVKSYEDIYADQLTSLFETETGLYLSLGRIR